MKGRAGQAMKFITLLYLLLSVIVVAAQTGGAVRAQPSVDGLLAQIFGTKDAPAYDLQAQFRGAFVLRTPSSSINGTAAGQFREWRRQGESRRWKIAIQELDLPWIMRPFSGAVRAAIEQKAEAQSQAIENFRNYDVFVSEEPTAGRYVLFGLRRDVVDEAITRFGKAVDSRDDSARRSIARWLATSQAMQSWVVRPGPLPYALSLQADDAGIIHEIKLSYEISRVGMKFSYLRVGEQVAWKEVQSTFASSNAKGIGRLEGELLIGLAGHRVDTAPLWARDAAADERNTEREASKDDPTAQP